jgi:DNA-binding HxlR family transcriptional regulator
LTVARAVRSRRGRLEASRRTLRSGGDRVPQRISRAHLVAPGMESKRHHPICPAVEAVRLVGTEWRLGIVRILLLGPMRFSDLERYLEGVDPKSLTRVLRALEATGIVERVAHADGGKAYALTEKGRALEPVIDVLAVWGRDWLVVSQPTSSAPSAR